MDPMQRFGLILAVLLGVAFFIGGVVTAGVTATFVQRSVVVEAVVAENKPRPTKDGVTYQPVFVFSTPDGMMQGQPKEPNGRWDFEPGSTVEVRYDPENTEHAVPTGFTSTWLLPVIFCSLGVFISTVAYTGGVVLNAHAHGAPWTRWMG